MQIQEILIVKNAKESYGISTSDISQISRVPLLMPLPLRPSGVRGLCAISGNIASVVDMNLLLGLPEVDYDNDKTRIVILNEKLASSALLVSEVYNTIVVNEKNIEYIEADNEPVIAIYKHNKQLIQVISLEILFLKINKVKIEAKEVSNGKVKIASLKEEESQRFLIFSMHNEQYAINIEFLREIILAQTTFTDIAGTSDEVLGLITLRDELLLVIDLRIHYGFQANYNDKNRILIASYEGRKIGLLVDEIVDIKNFSLANIEYMDDEFQDNKIAGVIHDGNTLISFFEAAVLENLFKEHESFVDTEHNEIGDLVSDDFVMEVIVFKLSGKEYAFEVANVAEIIDSVAATDVAFSDAQIDGIINIRGQIVAIVSLFEKLNIEPNINEDSKIIICEIDAAKIGFIVDSVSDILNVKAQDIKEHEDDLFSKVLHLENGKRLVLSMDIDEILGDKEK